MSARSPVLFLVFNRPELTKRVFEAIRAARPPRLYVAADGARPGRPGEIERCNEVRRIASAVDWPCELFALFRPVNLGCKRAVSTAITWFFENEAEGIVLEDDCLPEPSFFAFCDELLARYRDYPQVMCISGDNFISSHWTPTDSYYFSRYAHIWGWATWRRAWQCYDVDMHDWQGGEKRVLLERLLPDLPAAQRHWRTVFDDVSSGKIDTWDYQWTFACWRHGGVSCMPKVNLISNIGFGAGATHTLSAESRHANLAVGAMSIPLAHPQMIAPNLTADEWTSEHVFDIDERRSASMLGGALRERLGRWARRIGG